MPRKNSTDTKIYVLDTNILLHEPHAFLSFKEHDVVVPMTVLEELDYPPECRIFTELFYQYEDWRKQQQRISYADMLYDPVMCFRAHPELADRFGGHMQWLLVDEYQDINEVQQSLLIHSGVAAAQ